MDGRAGLRLPGHHPQRTHYAMTGLQEPGQMENSS